MADTTGTENGDLLEGTAAADTIAGLGGDDTIYGRAGNDSLIGGAGNDFLAGGTGDDQMQGDGGDDFFLASDGGSDTMLGGDGNDSFQIYRNDAAASVLAVDAGAGNDQLFYEAFSGPNYAINGDTITLSAGAGNDSLRLGAIAQASIDAGTGRDWVTVDLRSTALAITLGGDADVLQLNWNYYQWSSGTREVTDFQAGAGGDRLVFTRLNNGHPYEWTAGNPYADGYLRLVQQGADTLVQLDTDGTVNIDTFRTVLILRGVQASSLTQENLGYPLTGSAAGVSLTGTAGADLLWGQGGADTLDGLDGDDVLFGSNGNDTLNGGEGNDRLTDGFGNDVLNGGNGGDYLFANDGGDDQLFGGLGNDLLEASRTQFSSAGTVLLDGGGGNDYINYFQLYHLVDTVTIAGGDGDDRITLAPAVSASVAAGAGDDTLFVDVMGGPVAVSLGAGTDLLTLSVSPFAQQANPGLVTVSDFDVVNSEERLNINALLPSTLPNLAALGLEATRTGHFRAVQDGADTVFEIDRNGGADGWVPFLRLTGVDASLLTPDRLQYSGPNVYLVPGTLGSGATDQYIGTANDNAYYGGGGNDAIYGEGGQDTLSGEGGDDLIVGGDGNDTLFGGAGADRLYGGAGADLYWVDGPADLVFELDAGLGDTVFATGSAYLYANVENLYLALGSAAQYGVGNDLANTINGNENANLLIGGGGDDTIYGWSGNDTIFGGEGADQLNGEEGIDYLAGGNGNDDLRGEGGADALYGEAGDDYLSGGEGFLTDILVGGEGSDTLNGKSGLGDYDLLNGGPGDDEYWVDTPADLTFEGASEGTDTVIAFIDGAGVYLFANVENLVLGGLTPFGVGNELNNQLTGSSENNWLLGGAGNDRLEGKGGNDVLFGESGADTFVFGAGSGQDVIGDFVHGTDKIRLTGIFADFAQAHANFVQNGSDGAINLGGGNFVVLNGVTMSTLTATDFIFG